MPIMKEMSKDPEVRTKFGFVAIPGNKTGGGWDEKAALTMFGVEAAHLDWDGEMKLSGHWQEVRGSMERNLEETAPDADANPMDDSPVKVWSPYEERMHPVSMVANAPKVMGRICVDPRSYQWGVKDREGYFCYNPKTRKPEPLKEDNVKMFMQALENRMNIPEIGTDKVGGLLFIKKYRPNHEKFADFVGRPVKWELRLAETA